MAILIKTITSVILAKINCFTVLNMEKMWSNAQYCR